MREIVLDGASLTIDDVVDVSRHGALVSIADDSRKEITRVREYIEEHWISPESPPTYGFNTGVGKLKYLNIDIDKNEEFQNNIIMSHCGGVGEPAPIEVVRATMLVRINAFCHGVSGLRLEVIDRLLLMLNRGVTPVIPYKGSVGASGDLAPLAHMVSVLVGYKDAEAYYEGERMPAQEALSKAGITPIEYQLKAKDCLALINGTTMFAGLAALNCYDALKLTKLTEISAALSMEAVRAEMAAFDPRIHEVRRHKGQIDTAANIRTLIDGSTRTSEDARAVML
ncbi:MAG: aromatic amino acid lyase, partial [Clostridiaceae bacterium]|nr:aromatic amino acid lyase [Clostridiaceae bacterium]